MESLFFKIQIIVLAACLQRTGGSACNWPLAGAKFTAVFLSFASVWRLLKKVVFVVKIFYVNVNENENTYTNNVQICHLPFYLYFIYV
jgi:hypothetical protein